MDKMDICCIQILSHLENIFQIEAMAYKPILQAVLKSKPRGFLPGTCGSKITYAGWDNYIKAEF